VIYSCPICTKPAAGILDGPSPFAEISQRTARMKESRRSELANNPGTSVTNAIEQIAAEVMDALTPMSVPVCIEHYPSEATGGSEESFDLVVFAHHEVKEVLRAGIWRKELGSPTWKPLDSCAVEVLVDGLV
jgi:hypothetical protein